MKIDEARTLFKSVLGANQKAAATHSRAGTWDSHRDKHLTVAAGAGLPLPALHFWFCLLRSSRVRSATRPRGTGGFGGCPVHALGSLCRTTHVEGSIERRDKPTGPPQGAACGPTAFPLEERPGAHAGPGHTIQREQSHKPKPPALGDGSWS